MASILKVDTIQDQSGNNIINESADTITIGASGDTITVPTGATMTVPSGGLTGQNYPAFAAYNSTEQTGISDWTNTKVQYNTEVFDTNGYYDNSVNYRFTPLVAGKYFVYHRVGYGRSASNATYGGIVYLFKNGSSIAYNQLSPNSSSPDNYFKQDVSAIIDMNGTTDYLEAYVRIGVNSGTISVYAGITENMFMAYRIGA